MFESFANVWTPVLLAAELRRELSTIDVAGARVVVFRDESGRATALVDPDGPDEAADACDDDVLRLPTCEEAGLVWVFTGPDARGSSPRPPPSLAEGSSTLGFYAETWPSPFSRVMASLMDADNHPFVFSKGGAAGRGASRREHIEETSSGARVSVSFGEEAPEPALAFYKPNAIELFLAPSGAPRTRRALVFCFPEDDRSTRVLFCSTRDEKGAEPSFSGWITDFLLATSLARERAQAAESLDTSP